MPPDEGFLVLEEVFHLEDQLQPTSAHSTDDTDARRTMTTFSEIAPQLEGQAIEVPSWAYGNSGTRFKVFGTPGTPRTVQEKIADAAQVHRLTGLAPVGRAAHPVGPGRRLRRAARLRRGPRRRARHDQLQHLPGRRLQARRPDPHRPEDPPEGDRPPPRLRRRHGRDRVARPQDLARRRHQLRRPGRPARPPGPAGRVARHDLRAASAPEQRLVLEYKFFEPAFYAHRRARLGHGVRPGRRARRPRRRVPRHRPPRARAPTSSSS